MKYKICKIPLGILLSIIVSCVMFGGWMFSVWLFYPLEKNAYDFLPDMGLDENGVRVWTPVNELPISLIRSEVAQRVNVLPSGLYFFDTLTDTSSELLHRIDIVTGETDTYVELVPDEHVVRIDADEEGKFLVVWVVNSEDEKEVLNFRLLERQTGEWVEFKTPQSIKSFITVVDDIPHFWSFEYYVTSDCRRYFSSRSTTDHEKSFVFDSKNENFKIVKYMQGEWIVSWGGMLESPDFDDGNARYWQLGVYYRPMFKQPLKGDISYSIYGESVYRTETFNSSSFLRRTVVPLNGTEPVSQTDFDLPGYTGGGWFRTKIHQFINLSTEKFLLFIPLKDTWNQAKCEVWMIDGGEMQRTTLRYDYFDGGLSDQFYWFENEGVILIQKPDRVRGGEILALADPATGEIYNIHAIPGQKYSGLRVTKVDTPASIIYAPLWKEIKDDEGNVMWETEVFFWDVAERDFAGTVVIPGKVDNVHLVIGPDDPLPGNGNIIRAQMPEPSAADSSE